MPPAGLADATALELAALLRRREISAAEAAEASIAAVEAVNPLLNAVIRFDPDRVRAEAGLADERLGRGDTAPLPGVPFTVKDNIWVGGRVVSQGSALFADFVAPADALDVERLRRAGGVFRCTGASLCFQLAGVFGGAPAPLIALPLAAAYGSGLPVAAYLAVALAVMAASVLAARETAHMDLRSVDAARA